MGHYPMAFLTEKQIITKAEMAITQMGETAEDKPKGFKFLGTKKLRRGAAILVLLKEEDATWLKQDEKMKSFMSHLGLSTLCYRLQTYPILTTFIPLTFDSNTIALRRIEDDIGLQKGTIVSANWIKPPSKRSKDQTCGHMIFTLSDPEVANKLIRNQLYIEGKAIQVSKLLAEPRRCLKCQKAGAGHLAEKCPSEHNICGTCSKNHRTTECKINQKANMKCINCNEIGHPAWDRMCLTFQDHLKKFNARHPENKYKYYPTVDPNTWDLLGGNSRSPTQETNYKPPPRKQEQNHNEEVRLEDMEEMKKFYLWLLSNRTTQQTNTGTPKQLTTYTQSNLDRYLESVMI